MDRSNLDNQVGMARLPASLEAQLVPGTLSFAIHTLVESRMAMAIIDGELNINKAGCTADHIRILLKILLLAYCRGLASSYSIAEACRDNIAFTALTGGYVPDRHTIASFVSSMQDELGSIFGDVLLGCDQMKLLEGTPFAVGGSGPASDKSSGTARNLKKRQQELEEKVGQLIQQHVEADD